MKTKDLCKYGIFHCKTYGKVYIIFIYRTNIIPGHLQMKLADDISIHECALVFSRFILCE